MALAAESLMSVDEYLAFERESEQRHELVDGAVVAMGGGSRTHNRIAVERFSFAQKGQWTFTETSDLDAVLNLESIECELSVSDIYADVFGDE